MLIHNISGVENQKKIYKFVQPANPHHTNNPNIHNTIRVLLKKSELSIPLQALLPEKTLKVVATVIYEQLNRNKILCELSSLTQQKSVHAMTHTRDRHNVPYVTIATQLK